MYTYINILFLTNLTGRSPTNGLPLSQLQPPGAATQRRCRLDWFWWEKPQETIGFFHETCGFPNQSLDI